MKKSSSPDTWWIIFSREGFKQKITSYGLHLETELMVREGNGGSWEIVASEATVGAETLGRGGRGFKNLYVRGKRSRRKRREVRRRRGVGRVRWTAETAIRNWIAEGGDRCVREPWVHHRSIKIFVSSYNVSNLLYVVINCY